MAQQGIKWRTSLQSGAAIIKDNSSNSSSKEPILPEMLWGFICSEILGRNEAVSPLKEGCTVISIKLKDVSSVSTCTKKALHHQHLENHYKTDVG
ncbi:Hypothetical predicted protein [Podarcis lilfordi]|uniref:Uncharacterized protein n=1 Tax=Podarcis lilfordi TaxID=74358 RepID=A0AA35NXK4_9SAUR|nr:Hypothetical predicted protein [Podarcis lilfordi]